MSTRTASILVTLALAGAARAQLLDGSFESAGPAGPSAGAWSQTSTNFGSPLADASAGSLSTASNARTGSWCAWFGGIATKPESATLTQSVTLPAGQYTLTFWFKGDTQRSDALDTLAVKIDGVAALTLTSNDVRSGGAYFSAPYTQVSVPIPGTTGGTHQIQFAAATSGSTSAPLATNFYIDDVTLAAPCYANCDASTGSPLLTAADFSCFLTKFRAGDAYANCDGSTGSPTLTAADFTCFLGAFRAGCP